MNTAKIEHDIRLLLIQNKDSLGYILSVSMPVAELTRDGIRSPLSHGWGDDSFDMLDSFTISAQANIGDSDADGFYGWSVEFLRPFRVNLARAETMIKVLRKITRHLEKLSERFGQPADFAEYAGRVADGLGAGNNCFGMKVPPDKDYNGSGYNWGGVDSLRYRLNDMLAEARKGK